VRARWLAGVGVAVMTGCSIGRAAEPTEIGAVVPAYAAPDLAGDSTSLASLRGRVVVLNTWATWCPPCREEMPELQAVHEELRSAGVTVIAVSIDARDDAAEIREFLRIAGVTFPVLHDADERISRLFRATGVPETFLIDREGVLRHRWIGQISRDQVRSAARDLLEETAS